MQLLAYFGIILCLAVNMDTRSVEIAEGETSVDGNKELQREILQHEISDENSNPDNADLCTPNPCKNGGTCLKATGKCFCTKAYDGDLCEICKCENGFCEEAEGKSICKCLPEWGKYTSTFCKKCECGKDSNCTFEGFWTINKNCICKEGYEDSEGICKGTCETNPCKNGGKCVVKGNDIECECKPKFTGEFCEVTECPCENGKCQEINGKFTCVCNPEHGLYQEGICRACECGPGANCTFDDNFFTNKHCICPMGWLENNGKCVDLCSPNPCENGGTCDARSGRLSCICRDPYTGVWCNRDPCSHNPCRNNGICNIKAGTFNCTCTGTYGGDRCEKDLCSPNPCQNGGTCDARNGQLSCFCRDPYTGVMCERDPCSPNPCRNNGMCNIKAGTVNCTCTGTYGGDRCEKDRCSPNPCRNGGTCAIRNGQLSCLCRDPYTGVTCDRDPCSPNPCRNNGICNIKAGTVNCTCTGTYSGDRCEKDRCSPNLCRNGGTCAIRNGQLYCICREPYTGTLCERDPCFSNPCLNGGLCKINGTSFRCECSSPYSGKFCERDIFLFSTTMILRTTGLPFTVNSTTEGRTRNLSTTLPTESSSVRELKTDAVTRIKPDVTPVSIMKFTTPKSTSDQSSKDYSVNDTDEAGSTLQTTTQTQSTHTDLCAVNPCRNGGICKMEGKEARCYCISPFTGDVCEKDPCFSNPCMHGGLCKINGTSFFCECSSPYSGRFCEKDPCSKYSCHNGGSCVIIGNSSKCLCREPFSGVTCETGPCEENPCQNGGTCFVSENRFKCICKEPFVGNLCEADPCAWNPCKNGGICKIENAATKCFCKEPFTGEFCDSRSELDGNVITFAAFSVLLIIILTFVSCILRQRLQISKMSYEEKGNM